MLSLTKLSPILSYNMKSDLQKMEVYLISDENTLTWVEDSPRSDKPPLWEKIIRRPSILYSPVRYQINLRSSKTSWISFGGYFRKISKTLKISFVNSVCPDQDFALAILVFFIFALIKSFGKIKFRF